MKLSLETIKEKAAWEAAGIIVPSYDVEAVSVNTRTHPRWIHFGVGNIFRIFIGGIADRLLELGEADTGIICAETFDCEIVDKIYAPYDNLALAVTLRSDGTTKKQVIGSLAEAICADRKNEAAWKRLKQIFSDPGLQMASFTITEKGYAPTGAMEAVCALLYERWKTCTAPIAVVSMDNCSHNGEKLQNAVLAIAGAWVERGFAEPAFLSYLMDESKVTFPWTMIDKITPRPSDEIAKDLEQAGIEAMHPIITEKGTYIAPFVNAEEPQYLVIEDHFPNGRPPLEKAGVYMTTRAIVNEAERMKVTTCLNPLHTALAVYGCLLGFPTIASEMQDTDFVKLVRGIGLKEGMPVVCSPGILSPDAFVREVLEERLPNPFIPDTPQRIATDTSQKVGIRYGETIKSYVKKDGTAESLVYIPLAIAGWLRYLMGIRDDGSAFTCSADPMLLELQRAMDGIQFGNPDSVGDRLRPILSNRMIFGMDLYLAGIGERIEQMFREEIAGPGAVRETLKKYGGNV